jgi:hypothetical protein
VPIWETHNNSRQQTMLSLVCMAAGLALVALLHDATATHSNAQAGFWFGCILLLIGLATLAANAHQRIVVDPQQREIRIEDRRLLGRALRRIAFDDVQDVQVACLQTRSQHALRYFLQLQLAGGEPCALFAPERVYAGASDPAVVAGWRNRLNDYLKSASRA